MIRRIARWVCILMALAAIAAWTISLQGLHWGKPGVLSIYLIDGMISAENIAFKSEGWQWLNRPWSLSNAQFWPETPIMVNYPEVAPKHAWSLRLPLWIVVVAFLVPALLLREKRAGKSANACSNCHYDLTGNSSGKCPECGELIGRS